MTPLFKKMNWKPEMTTLLVLNAPQSFEAELAALEGVEVVRDPAGAAEVPFALAFVLTQEEVEQAAAVLAEKAPGDALVWMAYPKKSSKKYTSAINRDSGWAAVGAAGFEPVRQVAVDQDWSALRFRRVKYIQSFTRNQQMILSEEGKKRAAENEAA